ncbi:hypothetical protein [Streptomyces sp. NRRL S-1022]|uniref:hypothetical protein n=1 Tax=Streptomyces sp. NRRL S-1022 TaxID=1463880 RepID=UPI0004C26A81|nr:hypothetical protein [Streptomyces sp. NRRL S-1022]
MAAAVADWAAFLSLGVSASAAVSLPVLLWADADYLLIKDWQAVGDRVLVEAANARHAAQDARRAAAVSVAALLLLLSTPTAEVTR